ncbi:TaqI-like C-terminal specificity domain-containing protein [uncultured Chryseobacterium sp.]|uniref:TaqI-like C-terminal specificity domain-containing protein n=1 Tax=uncultured Chryseobacterium sp. TaxID=259322 RepID=UPI00258A35D0|nr:TaqI-like C-terminal specificity domain-containing protein [uncultured Chryseobacterium sp.]
MSDYFRQNAVKTSFANSESWIMLSSIEQQIKQKIERVGTPLKDWDIRINYGIKTGFNNAFIIDGTKRKELMDMDPKSEEIIRPILRGRDIQKYYKDFSDLYIINVHNGIKSKNLQPIKIDDYPAIKRHLDVFYKELAKRSDKGITPYNLRNCDYLYDFNQNKIIYPNMTKFLPFVYDDGQFLTNQKCYIITGNNIEYLTAFFNSSLFKYCFRDNFPELQGGTRELSKIFFDKIKILQVSEEINSSFKNLITKLQQFKRKGIKTKEIEVEIDHHIFKLYDLTVEEINEIGFIEIQ